MKVLILGGNTGFIGSHLSAKLKGPFQCEFVSMRNLSWVKDNISADCMINLVGKAHDFTGKATENDFFYANFELAKKAFDLFISSQAKVFIHISSLAAIEEVESAKTLAENATYNSVSPYGRSKQAAEEWLMSQQLPTDKKLIILRPPMVHGAGDKGNLKQLYSIVSKGIPYPLVRFKNKRSFLSIDNFCFYIEQILLQNKKLSSGIYHLSDDETLSSNEIVKIMKQETRLKVPCFPLPKRIISFLSKLGDHTRAFPLNTWRLKKLTSNLVVSNKKIKVALAIERLPKTAKEGLRDTIRALKQQH
ncbi:NAD-dependent epimerase/dehydratase family protein [Sphingobacterium sp. BIGb0116]|uniref:NAD-dependent epimerase/dehydratase family protein n=1 Tax=Sphingobacterium sp. BIGb0116 TaxID=2940619 RepID=UPI002167E34B|nr:NAD-dependent epimerase/dehydratase family protein [Sphingobacterium sp. BIGb0116]MCS4166204.1 nucleoside-diphosphate-sugar epimerase [Sphingobacterium sp. BIGb0116]